MKKRLWKIFGPVLIAFLALFILLLFPLNFGSFSQKDEQRAAVALNSVSFKNQQLKKQALEDKKVRYVPFFGSSEWERMDAFHPSVLAAKYHRPYRPFLLGKRGTQSLTQYFGMQTILPELKNKQAVFVVSPQWFDKQGVDPAAFDFYFSNLQAAQWLKHVNGSQVDRYAASRLVKVQGQKKHDDMTDMYQRVASGQPLTGRQRWSIGIQRRLLDHEDQLFSRFQISDNYQRRIVPRLSQLPKKYDYQQLYRLAGRKAARETNGNRFGIYNRFYDHRIKPIGLKRLAGIQKNFYYTQSPEYGDFQLVLNQLAKSKVDVMFVIPPVNSRWAEFTGLDQNKYQQAVSKIKYQLRSQGFDNIADFSHDGAKPYFMQDTIHLGWRGWLAFDRQVDPFLRGGYHHRSYKINNHFLSERWQQLDPSKKSIYQFR